VNVQVSDGTESETENFIHKEILLAAKKMVQFLSDGMSYVILGDDCYEIIVLNVHAPTELLEGIRACIQSVP
jgi:hypothetical protein